MHRENIKQEDVITLSNRMDEYKTRSDSNEHTLIKDGIVNLEKYNDAPIRIAWLLKEPYERETKESGASYKDWSLTEDVLNQPWEKVKRMIGNVRTWIQIRHITHCCLKGSYQPYTKISTKESYENLKALAVINIKKVPGTKVSNDKVISDWYKKFNSIINEQIDKYNPDVIISGGKNTLANLFNHLNITSKDFTKGKYISYYINGKQLIISASHPSYVRNYSNRAEEIIKTIINFKKGNLK